MKAALIGTGFGARVVAPIYRKLDIEVELVSPRDDAAIARACAAADFVSIHSPPFLHKKHVLIALEHRRPVLCDKPFGLDAAEARDMLAAAEAANVPNFLNFEFRQEEIRKKAKELIGQGAIGAIRHIQCVAMMSYSRQPLMRYRWLWNRELGGGWVGAFGSHLIDALRWWAGEIETATGICRTEIPYRPDADGNMQFCTAEDSFTACFTFASGATAVIDAGYAAAVTRPYSIEIFGTEGVLAMDQATKLELKRTDKQDQHFEVPPYAGDPHEPALLPWATLIRDAVRERRQIDPSFRDGLACAEVMEKLRANAAWVTQRD